MELVSQILTIGCDQWKIGSYKKAKIAFEFALEKLDNLGYDQADAVDNSYDIKLRLAHVHVALKEYDIALNYITEILHDNQSHTQSAEIHSLLGFIYINKGNLLQAAKEYDKALTCFSKSEQTSQAAAKMGMKVGLVYQKLRKYKRAIVGYNAAITRFSASEDIVMLATALSKKAHCLVNLNQISDATQVCSECVSLAKDLRQDTAAVNLYNEIALTYTQCKAFEQAAACLKLADNILQILEDDLSPIKVAAIHQNMGAVSNSLGNYEEAIQRSKEAIRIYGAARVRTSQCHCFLNMAFSYGKMGNLDFCEESYLHAQQAANDSGSKRDEWQALEGLAGVAFARGNHSKSIKLLKKALGICAADDNLDSKDQDRLVVKLYAVLNHMSDLPRNGSATPTNIQPLLSTVQNLSTSQHHGDTASIHSPQYSVSIAENLRPRNPEATRLQVETSEVVGVTITEAKRTKTEQQTKRRRRQRNLSTSSYESSRRNDREDHPIHQHQSYIHHGLASDNPVNAASQNEISRPGHKRITQQDLLYISESTAQKPNQGVWIKGLAVTLDDPIEPPLYAGNSADTVDGRIRSHDLNGLAEVRPMSRMIQHRRSTLVDDNTIKNVYTTGGDGYVFYSDSTDDISDSIDLSESDADGSDFVEENDDLEDELQFDEESNMERKATEDIRKTRPLTATRGRPMDEPGPSPVSRRFSKMLTRTGTDGSLHIGSGRKMMTSLLDTGSRTTLQDDSAESDRNWPNNDHQKQEKRNDPRSSPDASTPRETQEIQQAYLKQLNDHDESDDSDLASERSEPTDSHLPKEHEENQQCQDIKTETYIKPSSAAAVNVEADEKPNEDNEPLYATIAKANDSIPVHNAPPILPPKNVNFRVPISSERAESDSSSESESLTRGEREHLMYQKHKELQERKAQNSIDLPQPSDKSSRMCLVM